MACRSVGGARAMRPTSSPSLSPSPNRSFRPHLKWASCAASAGRRSRWPTRGRFCCATSRRCGPTRSSSPALSTFSHCSPLAVMTSRVSRTGSAPSFLVYCCARYAGAGRTDHAQMVMSVMRVVIVVLMASTALSAYGLISAGLRPRRGHEHRTLRPLRRSRKVTTSNCLRAEHGRPSTFGRKGDARPGRPEQSAVCRFSRKF